jgi:hypothetical protein
MFALRHPRGILCAKVGNKVNFNEYPSFPKLGSRNFTSLCHALQGDPMQMQEVSGLFKVKCYGH